MSNHPNLDRSQAILDAMREGDYAPAFDLYADDIEIENGPGAGPWHRARGKADIALMLTELGGFFGGTFHQDGHCVYADDRTTVALIHETGTAPGGDPFDNLAVYTIRLRSDGQADRIWTVDLDAEHCAAFWLKNPGTPSKDFS
jgi:ketosteroid isomerase-like protein